jgi:cell volume regulation protein A
VTIDRLNLILLDGAVVLLVAIVAVRLATRIGLPSLLAYLGLGLLLGEDVIGVSFSNAHVAQTLGFTALVLILAEGGLTTHWPSMRPVLWPSVALATVGVAITIGVAAPILHFALGLEWRLALLISAILSSTDAAAIFAQLRRLPVPLGSRLRNLLEAESGLNDPAAVLAVTLLSASHPSANPLVIVGTVAYELVAGAVIGVAIAWLGVWALRRVALPASGLYPLAVFGLAVGAYAVAAEAHASGFLAAYLAGIVLGNAKLPHGPATRSFAEGLGWLAQIGLFVMLGLLVNPSQLGREIVPALVVGLVLLLIARPAAVFGVTWPFKFSLKEQSFLTWAGLRGAVPIVLATLPVTAGVHGSDRIFNLVFLLVVIFTLVQGPLLPSMARWLRVTAESETRDLDVEAAPLEHLGAHLLQLRVPAGSRLVGVELFELRLPEGAAITLIVRDGRSFVPNANTSLEQGDDLLIVATAAARASTEKRLAAVHQRGKLARWLEPH